MDLFIFFWGRHGSVTNISTNTPQNITRISSLIVMLIVSEYLKCKINFLSQCRWDVRMFATWLAQHYLEAVFANAFWMAVEELPNFIGWKQIKKNQFESILELFDKSTNSISYWKSKWKDRSITIKSIAVVWKAESNNVPR